MRTHLKVAALAAALFATAAPGAAQPPAALKPGRVAGPGVNVRDLEAQRAWYESKLGMTVLFAVPAKGKPHEYIMTLGAGDRAVLVLQQSDRRPAGNNTFGRVILEVPDGKALTAWLKTQGVESREVAPNVAYFILDPEGNPVELYTPPKR